MLVAKKPLTNAQNLRSLILSAASIHTCRKTNIYFVLVILKQDSYEKSLYLIFGINISTKKLFITGGSKELSQICHLWFSDVFRG